MRFDEIPLTCQCKKEDERVKGFKFRTFLGSFSNGIMAVKVLRTWTLREVALFSEHVLYHT